MLTVDIGIACNKNQSNAWWPSVMSELMRIKDRGLVQIGSILAIGSALPDFSKNETVKEITKRHFLTDVNRSKITAQHLDGRADAIWWIDDDTVPPHEALERLLRLGFPIAAGTYVLRKPPCNPVAYYRQEGGGYLPLWEFQAGEIAHVDSVGMGCTLVHRGVYEEIQRQYVLFKRDTGSAVAVHRDDVAYTQTAAKQIKNHTGQVLIDAHGDAVQLARLTGPIPDYDAYHWPFYAMEYGRTEDHHFCEMAQRCGFDIVVDTSIECQHWGDQPISLKNFREMREWKRKEDADASA